MLSGLGEMVRKVDLWLVKSMSAVDRAVVNRVSLTEFLDDSNVERKILHPATASCSGVPGVFAISRRRLLCTAFL